MTENSSYTVSTVRHLRRRTLAPAVSNPRAVYDLIRPLVRDAHREHFYGVYLNARNRVLSVDLISVGTLNASIVHPREVFGRALEIPAASVVVVHNHPSGDPSPSREDRVVTDQMVAAGSAVGIPVLDHVIIGERTFVSLAERGGVGPPEARPGPS